MTPAAARNQRHRWHPGSRVARTRATHTYRWVLLLIVATFVFVAAAPDEDWTPVVLIGLESATLVLATWTSGLGENFRPGLVLCAIGIGIAVVQLVAGGSTANGLAWIANLALVLATVAVVGLGVFDQGEVNQQSVWARSASTFCSG